MQLIKGKGLRNGLNLESHSKKKISAALVVIGLRVHSNLAAELGSVSMWYWLQRLESVRGKRLGILYVFRELLKPGNMWLGSPLHEGPEKKNERL